MSNSARFRAFSNTLFSKIAWIASVALVATLLVAGPVSQTAAEATEAVIAPDSISVGGEHACAVVDGGVKCWGSNGDGQLGVDDIAASSSGVQAIAADSGVVQVSAGGYHSCALFATGAIKCWGDNYDGQLGTGDSVDTSQPTNVQTSNDQDELVDLTGATQVSAGSYHTCAIFEDAGVRCWGSNQDGQLGNGANGASEYSAVQVINGLNALAGATQVSAGGYHTCAVIDGGVMCWGRNNNGQLGSGDLLDTNQASSVVAPNDQDELASISGASQVSAGSGHTCAVVVTGVMCWGYNEDGALGDGTLVNKSVATAVVSVASATQVSAGASYTCAVVAGGVKCWGGNWDGQLGNGTYTSSANAVVAIAAGAGVVSVGTGDSLSCALLASEISCWGGNWQGQLGNGNVLSQETPVAVAGLEGAIKLAAGDDFTCAIMAAGTVKCWGDNWAGQLGNGSNTDSLTPVAVAGLSGVTAITAGDSHACALIADGEVECWGANDRGQLGNGSLTDSLTPVSVLTEPGVALTAVTKINAGADHTCAIVASSVKCWGYNDYWQQIDASGEDREFATAVVGLPSETAVDITENFYTTCVVVDEGVACLGGNLGSGTGQQLAAHLEIEDQTATAASLGDGFLCALISDGQVTCLGDNSEGQTGVASPAVYNSNTDDVLSPQIIDGLTGQVIIEVGDSHVCSLSSSGAVSCWGSNKYGQLGRSVERAETHIPAVVTGLGSGVTELAVSEAEHSCAIVASVVKCWGSNANGALGLPRVGRSATPITAAGVFGTASVTDGSDQQSANVDYTSLLKPELVKGNRVSVLKTGQQVTLTGSNLSNVQIVLVGSKTATIVSSSGSQIIIDVPADLVGSPPVTLVSKSGVQIIDGLIQIVQPYQARSVKVSSFKGNALTKDAAAVIRQSYLRDASVNIVSCAAVIGDGASAKAKAATIAKSLSACKAVAGYSVKFKTFQTVLRTLETPLKTPFVTVTFSRSKPILVN